MPENTLFQERKEKFRNDDIQTEVHNKRREEDVEAFLMIRGTAIDCCRFSLNESLLTELSK